MPWLVKTIEEIPARDGDRLARGMAVTLGTEAFPYEVVNWRRFRVPKDTVALVERTGPEQILILYADRDR